MWLATCEPTRRRSIGSSRTSFSIARAGRHRAARRDVAFVDSPNGISSNPTDRNRGPTAAIRRVDVAGRVAGFSWCDVVRRREWSRSMGQSDGGVEYARVGLYRSASTSTVGVAVRDSFVRPRHGKRFDGKILLAMAGHRHLFLVGVVEDGSRILRRPRSISAGRLL